ncbi:MAG TPA: type I DNA topoisomerase [Candidatus Babeliales bacterium]|nr:type I DNA topoisomerase [Candidatus Babeliales bacterium]
MKKLLIVESPAKIKTISKFLGKDFKIMSTVGHIMDLPKNKLGITMDGSIDLEYVVIDDKEKVIADICKEASKSDEIYLAPDPDREGEIIAFHIGQQIAKVVKKKEKIHRITFNEITKSAILDAIDHQGSIDMKKVAAQQARRILDRWVGYEVSPILWRKIAKGTSAGRVQSVALRLICDREDAIRSFKPEEYWSIHGEFEQQKAKLIAELTHIGKEKIDIKNEKQAQDIIKQLKKTDFVVDSITDKQRIKNPNPPFMTSTLQQAAYNRLGFSVKKTMQIAQKLYEGMPLEDESSPIALITYMRTDSLRIADSALAQVRSFIGKNYDKEYLPSKANIYSKSAAQDAHEAIRPIDVNITPAMASKYLPKDAARVYDLIWRRFVASQMQPAKYAQRQVVIKGDKFIFKVTGSTLIFDGFLKVWGTDKDEQEDTVVIPKSLKEKSAIDLTKTDPKQHFTQPPPRYTEASLVKELEKEGIGRPSTYATILSTIQARNYTSLENKKFMPTELGMAITKLLVANLPDIMDVKFTAHMEEDLDKIAHGQLERDKLLREFYKTFEKELDKFKGSDGKGKKTSAMTTDIVCPSCKKHKLAIRFGKSGEFLGCTGYPECKFTSNFKRDEEGNIHLTKLEEPQLLDEKCPLCGRPLRKVIGKFGAFVACSGYPECKYIKENKAGFKCPDDGGEVVERRWKGGVFWGCKNYPKCKFAVFGDIEETPCPKCKRPFLVKKVAKDGTITLFCSDKACGYKKVEKPEE